MFLQHVKLTIEEAFLEQIIQGIVFSKARFLAPIEISFQITTLVGQWPQPTYE
jgi:hypothetical protein